MFNLPSFLISSQLGIFILIAFASLMVIALIELIGMWCLLQKMGRHDFAALVPGYNIWEYSRGAGFAAPVSVLFILLLLAFIVCSSVYFQSFYTTMFSNRIFGLNLFLSITAGSSYAFDLFTNAWVTQFLFDLQTFNPWLIALMITFVLYVIFYIVATYGVAKSFGHGIVFTIAMLLFPFIFIPLLGISKGQRYHGPHFDKKLRGGSGQLWAAAVEARIQAFGSNAPLALSIIGLILSMLCMPIPALVLYIIALVRNRADKGKLLSGAKRTATIVIVIIGIIISILSIVLIIYVARSSVGLLGLI